MCAWNIFIQAQRKGLSAGVWDGWHALHSLFYGWDFLSMLVAFWMLLLSGATSTWEDEYIIIRTLHVWVIIMYYLGCHHNFEWLDDKWK